MRIRVVFGIALGALVIAACSSAPQGGAPGEPLPEEATRVEQSAESTLAPASTTATHGYGIVPYRGGDQPAVAAQCRNPALSYFGGPIVMSPIIVPVFWSSNVNPALTAPTTGMAQFFADVTQSTYWPWLQEYDTVGLSGGTEQAILAGSATAGVTLTPSHCAGAAACTVTDAQIQTELSAQITAGNLPVPQVDCTGNTRTLYMIDFPPNVKVTGPGVGTSCVQFCAYHSTGPYGASAIPLIYGVLMDEFTAACKTGCGTNATPLENMTDTASHELAESVTDPDIGLDTANAYARPAAWGDNNNGCGEIGDICDNDGTGDTIVVSGRSWVVQELWSNKQGKCTSTGTTPAVCSGTTVTNCRRCSCGDDGDACMGGTSVCETTSSNVLFGGCEQCTSLHDTCGTGNSCTQSATPAQDDICSSTCVPITSCPAPDNCGSISNGCGGMLGCGSCTAPQTCGGGTPSSPNVCGCAPLTTCPAGDDCGSVSNGCGGMITCGSCAAPQSCGGGTPSNPNVCGCTALTACPAGDDCGSISDGCGGMISCGTCTAPQTCGGGSPGTPNVCGAPPCTPATSCPTGFNCGVAGDGCGGTINCGTCGANATCVGNTCETSTPDAGGHDGGSVPDSGSGGGDSGAPHDAGSTPDSGSSRVDSGSGPTTDSGAGTSGDSGTLADSGTSSSMDGSTAGDGGNEGDASGDAGNSALSDGGGGCGCKTAQAREAGPPPALLAFGSLILVGGLRLRRRRRGRDRD